MDLVCGRILVPNGDYCETGEKIILETQSIVSRLKLRGSVCAKLYKTCIIKENSFCFNTNMRVATDALFSYQYFALCKRVAILSNVIYYYEQRPGSALHSFVPDYDRCRVLRTLGVKELYTHFPKMSDATRNAITATDSVNDLHDVSEYYTKYAGSKAAIQALGYLHEHYKDLYFLDTGEELSSSARRFLHVYGDDLRSGNMWRLYWRMRIRGYVSAFFRFLCLKK